MRIREALLSPLRQRYPFLPLLLAALAGILLSGFFPWSSPVWLCVALAGAILFFFRKPSSGLALLALGIFASIHLWQSRESPARLLYDKLGGHTRFAEVVGMVDNEPRIFSEKRAGFRLSVEQFNLDGSTSSLPITILVDWVGPPPAYGDKVKIRGTLTNLEPPRNPGQFDFSAWAALHQIYSRIKAGKEPDSQEILAHDLGNPLGAMALRTRAWMRGILESNVNDPAASNLIIAMVLGDTSKLPGDVEEEFRGTGTYHLFSVSGLHVGMLAILLWTILRLFRVGRRTAAVIIIPLLFFYTLMTGLSAASVRSAIMGGIVLAGFLANRKPILFNNLCAAAFLLLLADTNQVFDPGFQLSFTVVAAIILFAEPLAIWLKQPFHQDPFLPEALLTTVQRLYFKAGRELAVLVSVSVSAWAGSFLLIVGYFHMISLTTLPANLVAVPVSFGIMSVSMLSLISGVFSPWIATVFNQTNWLFAKILLGLIHSFASVPGSFFYVKIPEFPKPVAEIIVFDFGTGGGAFIRCEGKSWLIDCGPAHYHDHMLLPFLRSQGLSSLDGLLLTHGDSGHIGATTALLDSCRPFRIIDSTLDDRSKIRTQLREELAKRQIPKSLFRTGDHVRLGRGASLNILFPSLTGPVLHAYNANEQAIVVRLDIDSFKILFTSDAPLATEKWLLKNSPSSLPCDILIEGSPRLDSPKSSDFLDAVNPHLVIMAGNDSFAPRPPPCDSVESRSGKTFPLFSQNDTGAVRIRVYRDHFEVSSFLNNRQYTSHR
ncbi:hypothetical protein BH09VER1_BH09VER1_19970 [soil metagenome]